MPVRSIPADPFPAPNLKGNLGTASFYQRRLSAMVLNTLVAHSNNLKLAQRMYQARVSELKQLILAEEARFKFVFILEPYTLSLIFSPLAPSPLK